MSVRFVFLPAAVFQSATPADHTSRRPSSVVRACACIFKIFDGHLFFYAEGEDAPSEDDEGEWPPMELREFRTMIKDRGYLWCER